MDVGIFALGMVFFFFFAMPLVFFFFFSSISSMGIIIFLATGFPFRAFLVRETSFAQRYGNRLTLALNLWSGLAAAP
jgi:hypothetical protein